MTTPETMSENMTPVMVIYNSGIILSKLVSIKEAAFSELKLMTKLEDIDFYTAIGYLLCEKKIAFHKDARGNHLVKSHATV